MSGMQNTCKNNFPFIGLFVLLKQRGSDVSFRFSLSRTMKEHPILSLVRRAGAIFCLLILYSCTEQLPPTAVEDGNNRRSTQAINLFPEDDFSDNQVDKVTWEEAFAGSKLVIRSTNVQQISHSNTRSAQPFYVYQVKEGSLAKSVDSKKLKLPLLFVSRRELFKGKVWQDSVYLFLLPIKHYKVLQKNTNVAFAWMDEAPF